MTWHWLNSTKF